MTAVALLSGGLDSTVATAAAHREVGVALALAVDYGQRAAAREVEASGRIAAALGVPHRTVSLDFLADVTGTALVDADAALPRPDDAALDDAAGAAADSMAAVWVPNRNGLFVAVAATFAEGLGADRVVVGFNREEAATFPDNSEEFVDRTNAALSLSTRNGVRVVSPTAGLDKEGIVRMGYDLDAPLALVWSCYEGRDRPCGTCESCRRLARALDRAGRRQRFEEEWNRAHQSPED
ncbi:MAG: 7-cyano-7-deazaguanine synthase QueC [Planctomycetota bacterium JB042]